LRQGDFGRRKPLPGSGVRVLGVITRLVLALSALAVVGGAVALATWDLPVPSAHVEKPIPMDRFKP